MPPSGLRPDRLGEGAGPLHAGARRFCLDTIREVYGFGYRQDWHGDLDSLLLPPAASHYSRRHRGGFWTLRDGEGAIVATAGVRHLAWKPNILAMFPGRFPRAEDVAFVSRVYVRADRRGQGLGSWLTALCETEAAALGYPTAYLHAAADAPATLRFWARAGYDAFATCGSSRHFGKPLTPGCR